MCKGCTSNKGMNGRWPKYSSSMFLSAKASAGSNIMEFPSPLTTLIKLKMTINFLFNPNKQNNRRTVWLLDCFVAVYKKLPALSDSPFIALSLVLVQEEPEKKPLASFILIYLVVVFLVYTSTPAGKIFISNQHNTFPAINL